MEAEARIADHLVAAEKAHTEGRLSEYLEENPTPPVKVQLRPFFTDEEWKSLFGA